MCMVEIASSHGTIQTWQSEIDIQNNKLETDKYDTIGNHFYWPTIALNCIKLKI